MEMFRLFGYAVGEVTPSQETFIQAVHPDDHPIVGKAIQDAFAGMSSPFEFRTSGRMGWCGHCRPRAR